MKAKQTFVLFLVSIMVAVLIVLWATGLIGLWNNGMSHIVSNTTKYTNTNGHLVPGQYSLSIDLSNLESNIGKELYNDGNYKIYVSWIDNSGNINSGGYSIGFRSSGQYSLAGASLISGNHHAMINENAFTTIMTATMTATYNNKSYDSSEYGYSGINYKDGDEFYFYIFPNDAYENKDITLNETGVAQLTVTNLYKNIWSKN